MNNIFMKIYKMGDDVLIAACDAELLGKILVSDEIEFKVSEGFYKDVLGDEKLFKKNLSLATIGNLIGERCVRCAIEMGLVDPENVIRIGGIPHAQFVII
ncbi:MAG: DUF424 family protein [Thermoplasmatales archaeon]|nr:DUF424 family protein [Thermoplasmatales archaeon]